MKLRHFGGVREAHQRRAGAASRNPDPERGERGGTWTDQRIETILGKLLQTGVTLAACVVLTGAAIYLKRHAWEPVGYGVFRGEPVEYKTVRGILHGVATWRGRGFIQLGLLLLIATPVARVAFSVWAFAEEKDKMYVGFTLFVLAVLLYSLFGSGSAF